MGQASRKKWIRRAVAYFALDPATTLRSGYTKKWKGSRFEKARHWVGQQLWAQYQQQGQ